MSKQRILICGIAMECAGTEKAFLSLADRIDYDRYDVTLLLSCREGKLLQMLPPRIRVVGPMRYGEMFRLSSQNVTRVLLKTVIRRHPFSAFRIASYYLKQKRDPEHRADYATAMWVELMKRYCPTYAEEFGEKEPFDACLAFWGDRTMFYMCDKVQAKKKLAWLHFDYAHPKRPDDIYLSYFERCNAVINVTKTCTDSLRAALPSISDKCMTIENLISPSKIRALADNNRQPFPDPCRKGIRLLTVARICEQKGSDRIPAALKALTDAGHDVRWYLLGTGEESDLAALRADAEAKGVSDRLIFLGTTQNPYPYIAACDIFVLPSRYEGRPITIEEAKILARPIVVCDYLSAAEQLDNGAYGVICPQSAEGLAAGILSLLDNPQKCSALSELLSSRDFSTNSEYKKLENLLNE